MGGRGIAPQARNAKINEIPFGSLACSVDIVEFANLLIIGHVSGHITIWKLPSTSELDAFVTKRMDERSLNLGVPGKIVAHHSGMVSMCGIGAWPATHSGVATAGTFGSVLLWPIAELENAADRAIKENGGKMRRKKRGQLSQEKLSAGRNYTETENRRRFFGRVHVALWKHVQRRHVEPTNLRRLRIFLRCFRKIEAMVVIISGNILCTCRVKTNRFAVQYDVDCSERNYTETENRRRFFWTSSRRTLEARSSSCKIHRCRRHGRIVRPTRSDG